MHAPPRTLILLYQNLFKGYFQPIVELFSELFIFVFPRAKSKIKDVITMSNLFEIFLNVRMFWNQKSFDYDLTTKTKTLYFPNIF